MTTIERLFQYFDYKHIKPTRFEKDFGFSNGYFGGQLKRKADIGSSILEKIIDNCRDLNINWLISGEGQMITDNHVKNTSDNILPSRTFKNKPVPFFDLPVSAGPLGVLVFKNSATEPDGYIDLEIFNRCDAIFPIVGISLEPLIHSGDLIGIRRLDNYNWEYIETGKIYMIITREERMIKFINKADDSDYIVCSSPNYHDFKVRKDEIIEMHRVLASIKAF
jgi:hypothetical protein